MLHSPLQSLFIQPRQGKDPRVAKTDDTLLGVGSDGKLYKMLDPKDWNKFRILTENEQCEELQKSREIKENMYMLNGKGSTSKVSSGLASSSGKGIKLVAPQFGTQSRTRKMEKKAWEKGLLAHTKGDSTLADVDKSDPYYETMATLARNQLSSTAGDASADERTGWYESERAFRPADGGLAVSQSAEDRIQAAVRTMREKYEQNLQVVEQLFDEKRYMERKVQVLEQRLRANLSGTEPHEDEFADPSAGDEDVPLYEDLALERGDYEEAPHARSSVPLRAAKRSAFDPDEHLQRDGGKRSNGSNRPGGLSALEAAAMLDSSRRRPESAPAARGRASAGRASTADDLGGRSSHVRTSRSSSAGRSGRVPAATVTCISANLQADADRYIQKRRMWEEQERQRKLDEERYEQQLKERFLRASMNGKGFPEMLKRQEEAERKAAAKRELFLQKQAEAEEALRRERKAKAEANRQSMTAVIKNQLSWRELQEIEEAKRRDRIEAHKQRLMAESALPSSIAESLQRPRKETPASIAAAPRTTEFKAEDPGKVARKLAIAQKMWEKKMERERERIKEKSGRLSASAELGGSQGSALPKTAMEIRTEQYAAKREARAREKKEREEAEARRLKGEEEKKRQKLLAQNVPLGKPTNAAIMKAEKVRNDRLREEEEERRLRAKLRKKELASKEAAAVIKVIMDERRASNSGTDHYELRGSSGLAAAQRKAAEAAAAAREQYRQQLRANKKRIEESLANRKSLIERHDATLAVKTASQEALQKVAHAVGVDKGAHASSASADSNLDLFDAKEQVRLGLRSI